MFAVLGTAAAYGALIGSPPSFDAWEIFSWTVLVVDSDTGRVFLSIDFHISQRTFAKSQ